MSEKRTADVIVKEWKKDPDRVSNKPMFNSGVGVKGMLHLCELPPGRLWLLQVVIHDYDTGETKHGSELLLEHTTLVSLRLAIDDALEFTDKRGFWREGIDEMVG